jgi:hypothetical protein
MPELTETQALGLKRVRDRWMRSIFNTQPADRKSAEEGVRRTYRTAGVSAPEIFLWLDDLLQALLVVEQLGVFRESNWQLPEESRELREELLSGVQQQHGFSSWDDVIQALGPKHTKSRPGRVELKGITMGLAVPRTDSLQGGLPVVTEDKPCEYQAIEDAAQELDRIAIRYWITQRKMADRAAGPGIPGHGGLPWVPSIYDDYRFSMLFRHDCLARIFRRGASMAYDGLLRTMHSAGPWWPFAKGAVLCERPSEAHRDDEGQLHRADGPAVVYRTGFAGWAWHETPIPVEAVNAETLTSQLIRAEKDPKSREALIQMYGPEKWEEQKRREPKPKLQHPLEAWLIGDPPEKIEKLRAYGPLPLHDRYVAGDHRGVWTELRAVGDAVREEPRAADALAVSYATMMRVRQCVTELIERLTEAGYEFDCTKRLFPYTPMPPMIQAIAEYKKERGKPPIQWGDPRGGQPVRPIEPDHVAPGNLRRLQKDAGDVPLAVRAWWEVIGAVDLRGKLRGVPLEGALVMRSFSDVLRDWDNSPLDVGPDGPPFVVDLGARRIPLSCPYADPPLEGEPQGRGFLEYVRASLDGAVFGLTPRPPEF